MPYSNGKGDEFYRNKVWCSSTQFYRVHFSIVDPLTLIIQKLVGFGRVCAPMRCAHPSFSAHCHTKQGAARPPAHRSFAAYYSAPRNAKSIELWLPTFRAFSFNWTTCRLKRLWNMRSLAPCLAHRSFPDPSGNILGSKLWTGATKRPNFFRFFLFCRVFGSFLFVILFFLFSSYSSLFILLFLSLLYHSSSSYILNCLLYYRHEISVILRDFLRGPSLC